MSYIKLVKTILLPGDNKYEVFAAGEHAKVERIIHYKLRSCKNNQGHEGKSEAQWVVYNPDFPIPTDGLNNMASNIGYYLAEL